MTFEVPSGNVSPGEKEGVEMVALPRSSVAVGSVHVTLAVSTPESVGTVMSLGQSTNTGDSSSVGQ